MALTIPNINLSNTMSAIQNSNSQTKTTMLANLGRPESEFVNFSAKNNPTALILQSAMDKINEQFVPHLDQGALQQAVDSGQDMSPKATAERILSFATILIGRAEADQTELPIKEQRSREQLFQNIQTGVENGFEQARTILEGMQALDGKVKDSVNSTYEFVQQGLRDLAVALGLESPKVTQKQA